MDEAAATQLEDKVDEIRGHLAKAKADGWSLNEADTERVVIFPLLTALGYGPLDIRQRGHDSVANNFPDYTLLPGKPQKWFLEVKKLDLHLQDGEAAQAVNYANNQGAEWAVLTNGRKWFIYNAHLPKPLPEKRVFQIDDLFADASALKTLAFLSSASMLSGGLSAAWAFERVQGIVKAQLETPNSAVHKHLRKIAADETKAAISDALIEEVLCSLDPILPSAKGDKSGPIPVHPPPPHTVPTDAAERLWHLYTELTGYPTVATGRKPDQLLFTGGEIISVTSWIQAAHETATRVCAAYRLPPLPFNGGIQGKRYFINTTPTHVSGEEMQATTFEAGGQTVYMHSHRSAQSFAKCLVALFDLVGAPADFVKVSIK